MILNPTKQNDLLQVFGDTRLLVHDFDLVGTSLGDPKDSSRVWTIHNLFKPLPRCIGGIRARCLDQKGFMSFIDQMSLEVLLGMGAPGDECVWADRSYPSPSDRDWFGFCCDYLDVLDDLYVRELGLRRDYPILPAGMEISFYVHSDHQADAIDRYYLIWDGNRETGISPDTRMSTIESRWARIEREAVKWSRI